MNELEKKLLRKETNGMEPRLVLRTRTKIDAGCWVKRPNICLCVLDHDLIILAVGRRQYAERVSLSDCRDSHYCHATGEFLIEPAEGLEFNRFKLSPRNALVLMKSMGITKTEN